MSNSVVLAIVVAIVVIMAIWMKNSAGEKGDSASGDARDDDRAGGSGSRSNAGSHAEVLDDSDPDDPDDPDDDADADRAVAAIPPDTRVPVTSEGIALVAAGSQVRLVDLAGPEEMPGWLEAGIRAGSVPYSEVARAYARTMLMGRGHFGGASLHTNDFTAARIRREPGGGWNVETLGRDGDFGFMPFDTEGVAREVLEMIQEAGIVQQRVDEEDRPVPASSEDFEEARRRYDQTERDLAVDPDDDDPKPSSDWSSRR